MAFLTVELQWKEFILDRYSCRALISPSPTNAATFVRLYIFCTDDLVQQVHNTMLYFLLLHTTLSQSFVASPHVSVCI